MDNWTKINRELRQSTEVPRSYIVNVEKNDGYNFIFKLIVSNNY